MALESEHKRRSTRLRDYDYAQAGAYFLTFVTQGRLSLFGDVVRGEMTLSTIGETVRREWLRTPEIRLEIELDQFIVMPNHFHGIVFLRDVGFHGSVVGPDRAHRGAPLRRAPRSVSSLVAGFKATTTRLINEARATPGQRVWQRNYHDRIIRNEREFLAIRRYIYDNPANWGDDPENGRDP